jgi:hypothetical protein
MDPTWQDFSKALELVMRQKHDSPTGTPSTPYYHGPGGLFGVLGLERDIISTRVQPMGLAGSLPARATNYLYPRFPYLTGFQATTGDDPDGVCDDGPVAGAAKACVQTADFGRYTYMTRELELNHLGQRINRGEFDDLMLVNDPLLSGEGIFPGVSINPALAREVLMRFVEVGVAFQNKLAPQLWIGNPANNSANGGYAEFPGLDILIGTSKIDAITGVACPSLASDVKDFNYQHIDDDTSNIVNVMTYMLRYLKWNASRMNLAPATWTVVMRPELFYELTAVWPCAYMTYRCSGLSEDAVLSAEARDMLAMRDAMRAGMYLTVDGENWPVALDDGITEESSTTNANVPEAHFSSNIYVVPRTVVGGRIVTFWEFYDYTSAMQGASDGGYQSDFWTDSGRFLWHRKPSLNWCVQWISKIEPRIILQTPQLAGRLNNVVYSPLQHTRTPFPNDPYNLNGGVTSGYPNTRPYSEWNLP